MRLSTSSYNPPIACSQSDVINSDSDCAPEKDFFRVISGWEATCTTICAHEMAATFNHENLRIAQWALRKYNKRRNAIYR